MTLDMILLVLGIGSAVAVILVPVMFGVGLLVGRTPGPVEPARNVTILPD